MKPNLKYLTQSVQANADTEKKKIDAAVCSRVIRLFLDALGTLSIEDALHIIEREHKKRQTA